MKVEPWSEEWKLSKLYDIEQEWKNCEACGLCKGRKNVVVGTGNPNADIFVVGEAPGKEEDQEGVPFIGESGKLLRVMWGAVDQEWDDLFVTNVVACRPPKNRDPLAAEKDACQRRIHQLLYIIDPLIIVAVGKYAMNAMLGGRAWGIEKEHGKLFSSPGPEARIPGERNGVEVPGVMFPKKGRNKLVYRLEYDLVPIFHPAYIMRVDSYDEGKQSYPQGGEADQTMDDMTAIKERVQRLKTQYEATAQLIERK